ncbi:MAG: fumarylacetoacetate hydrolase family protein [Emergencia timonensis]|uniref:fumarylacetoacetate hydrolase family protein n=1 Tax=Emergencia timonensis TaxID=1776384 RepID=UPI000835BB1F|nr:fumarylacetoacetate hydrolase family protein [Emergencia timonensis]WNX87127.1 fumarylacetoacetate hydrolase family protein [Emergencia timonensis]
MRFLTYKYGEKTFLGVLTEDGAKVLELSKILLGTSSKTMIEFIDGVSNADLDAVRETLDGDADHKGIPLAQVKLLAPITRPIHDILCVGVNYKEHLEETKRWLGDENFQKPPKSIYFSKRAVEIIGPGADIVSRMDLDEELDYEVELAVIIGKKCKDVTREEAEDVIFGYSVFNDISARTLQRDHQQWSRGKGLDTFSAMGPVIVTRDEMPFPIEVDVISSVNGEERQHSNTALFLNDIPGIIADLSAGTTLEPGDIIATGTPSGVALGMKEPKFMKPGDCVTVEIPQIGKLTNYVI